MEGLEETTVNVTTSVQLDGPSEGYITVSDGGSLVVNGVHEGTIELETGGHVVVNGVVRGSVTIGSLGTVIVHGDIVGTVDIRVAGTLVVEADGRVSAAVNNFGSFTNRGLRAGRVEGRNPDDQEDSTHIEAAHVGGASYQLPQRQPAKD